MSVFWCHTALIDGDPVEGVRVSADADGRIRRLQTEVAASAGDVPLGLVLPGFGNAHSHAFHRALRGRTHDAGGDFWQWRQRMYAAATALDPELYEQLAHAVFAEMLTSGYTAVGEFHYLHHRPGGAPWCDQYAPHAMEHALARAARACGIRLTLLDTCYLAGGIGQPLAPEQAGFSDETAERYLERWYALRDSLTGYGDSVRLGAALHSVRGVPRAAITTLLAGLPSDVPLHMHLSEQPQENADCVREYGLTPTGLLAELGALSPRLSVVHATHLTETDLALLGAAGVTAVFCPTTEADLGDGIGPARRLVDAGARLALGSDQNAVVDPLLEIRGLEYGERLASGRRGRFSPAELARIATDHGYRALGLSAGPEETAGGLRVGAWCDLVELDAASVRTAGADPGQIVLAGTAADVRSVIVGGRVVAQHGLLVTPTGVTPSTAADPAVLLERALARLDTSTTVPRPASEVSR
ncbi:formimidoylglutamate deiminase [Cryobacterium melibiosiphilum]|uniref:Formimidoylglutamate deiminase n=1 Tax=Cryobacterium melibiosiphilum TaxID=995039 RepID=A0A3A5MIJ3_9MICO|nr:formimidoylglutamate deiminase [Cryobacterium melibiosiphilum]RJT85737.1 formimidoylglutamate deiminase [Cryobacterium melibiosiphilum]